jgi:hypothetical protein
MAVVRVVLQQVGVGLGVRQVVNGDDINGIAVLFGDGAESDAPDASETVNSNFDWHESTPLLFIAA